MKAQEVTDAPLTAAEERWWARSLGSSRHGRIQVLKDLLKHAEKDRMTPEDLRICKRWLRRLEHGKDGL